MNYSKEQTFQHQRECAAKFGPIPEGLFKLAVDRGMGDELFEKFKDGAEGKDPDWESFTERVLASSRPAQVEPASAEA